MSPRQERLLAAIRECLASPTAWRGCDYAEVRIVGETLPDFCARVLDARLAYADERARTLVGVVDEVLAQLAEEEGPSPVAQARTALEAVLPMLSEMSRSDVTYGYYCGGDPRDFSPDRECCTAEEIAAWESACAAWERGERPDPGGPHQPLAEGETVADALSGGAGADAVLVVDGTAIHKTVAHYGVGTTTSEDPEARELWLQVVGALEALREVAR